jgi:hypothetical protein
VLVLNVGKEVEKDTAVILDAGNPAGRHRQGTSALPIVAGDPGHRPPLPRPGGRFPVEIVVRYDEIIPFRTRRIRLMHEPHKRSSVRPQ